MITEYENKKFDLEQKNKLSYMNLIDALEK